MPAAVHLADAVCLIGSFPVLAGVDLEVGPGEVVLVEGPNGAGKTSLLRACAGLLPLSSGTGTVLGHDLSRRSRALRRQLALVGHAAFLYDDLSVEDNVVFAVRAAGAGVAGLDRPLSRAGLDGRLRRTSVGRLSAGQRRRVVLAVLMARHPPLWLLDEPHAGLDALGRDLLDELVVEAAAGGTTVLVASHEAERARPLAHRAVTMVGGRIGSPAWAPSVPGGVCPDPAGGVPPERPAGEEPAHVA